MSRLFLLAFLAFTASAMLPLNEPNPSNVNLAVDYATLDTMKTTLAQPLVTRFVKNISIPGNITEKIGIVDVFVNNIIIVDVDMDWPNSRILMVEKDGKPTVMLKDVMVTVQFDAKVKFGFIKESGEKNIVKATVDVTLELGFAAIDDIFFGFIAKQDIPVKHLDLDFHGGLRKVANALKKALGSSLDKKVAGIIHDKVNDANKTIVELTSKPIVVNATPPIDIHGALVNFPEILNIRWADSDRQVQTATLDIEAFKDNVKYEPPAKLTVMPTYVPDFAPLQAIVSQEIFQVAVWTVFQTDLTDNVKIIISEGIVPKESPIHLITTNLTDLVPSIVEQFGADKGVYLRITKGGLYPNVEITDAKIHGEVAVLVEVIVDTDSSNYPKEGLNNCGACKLAYRLNATGTASLNVFKVSPLSIGGEIYEGKLNEVEVISGDADAEKIKNGLNAIVKPLIEQVNQELKGGIDLPDIVKKYGLNDTNVRLESDHLVVGGDFTLPHETPLIYW